MDDSLGDMSVQAFIAALAADQPAPGGGAAGALAAAAGAALIEMVCRFSLGREQFAQWEDQIATTLQTAALIRRELLATMDADAAAFAAVTTAYNLPHTGKEERAHRRHAVNDALAVAALPPLQVATAATTLAELALGLVGRTNGRLVSDLGSAGALLEAGLRIAGYNLEANTRALKGDPRAATLQEQLEATRTAAGRQLDALDAGVQQALTGGPPE